MAAAAGSGEIRSEVGMVYAYMHDTYRTTIDTKVKSLGKEIIEMKGDSQTIRYIVLEDTVFHPQGGGQRSDVGTIAGVRVLKAVKHGSPTDFVIRHLVEDYDGLEEGQSVKASIDLATRVQNARLHSAGHLIASVGEAVFPQLKAVQGHHYPGEARVEFTKREDAKEELPEKEAFKGALEKGLDRDVKSDLPVTIHFEGGRSVQYGEYEKVPCGGTHVDSTSKIGAVDVKGIKVKKGMLRVSYSITA